MIMKKNKHLIIVIALLLMFFGNNAHAQRVVIYVCSGETATLTASIEVADSIINPTFKWYDALSGGTLLYTGATFVSSTAITADTVFYVALVGDNYNEGSRLTVNLIPELCTGDVMICSGDTATLKASLKASASITNPAYKWYDSPNGGTPICTEPTFKTTTAIMADTSFYVSVEGDGICAGPLRKVNVRVVDCASLAKKKSTLLDPLLDHNGTYPNPVSILHGEKIKYEITATNANPFISMVTITDTLPAYLDYVAGTADNSGTASKTTGLTPNRDVIKWSLTIPDGTSQTVSFEATPASGASASQPLFINTAKVGIPGLPREVPTNSTYHQGAGISITTFSAGFGGYIFNASEQALDYMTTPRSGVLIAPEEGYAFAGWSHDGYVSLRGAMIAAQEGIMHYDTLIIYGHVELHANFVPVELSLDSEEEFELHVAEAEDKVWAVKNELFIMTTKPGSIVRIYSTEGVLQEQHTIVVPGTTSRKLPRGVYITTINNRIGQKVRVE